MRITIINQPLNNRGDEAAHRSLMKMLVEKFSNAKFFVLFVGANPNSVRQFTYKCTRVEYINYKPFPSYGILMRYALKNNRTRIAHFLNLTHYQVFSLIKSSDLVINAPGGVCMGAYQSWRHLWYLKVALCFNKKVAYYSRSIGPFPEITDSQRRFKSISMEILQQLDFISLRDDRSQELAKEIGINFVASIDTAFLNTPKNEIPETIKTKIGQNYVVFVPNELIWHPHFRNISSDDIDELYHSVLSIMLETRPTDNIVMLPQLFNSSNNDIDYFYSLRAKVNNDRVIVIEDKYSSDVQQAVIAGSKFLIGGRYHSIIFAINNLIPFIALSYEHKISGLLSMLELETSMIELKTIFDDKLGVNVKERESSLNKVRTALEADSDKSDLIKQKKELAVGIAQRCSELFYEQYSLD